MENETMETMQMENAEVEDMAIAERSDDCQYSEKSGSGKLVGFLIGAAVTGAGIGIAKITKKCIEKAKASDKKTEKKERKKLFRKGKKSAEAVPENTEVETVEQSEETEK